MEQNSRSPKQRQIVSTARALFWKFGIRRVSVEEICTEAGVSKMTFYKYFSNKNELVKFILEEITAEAISKYRRIMNQKVPFPEKVKQSIQLKIEQTEALSQEFFEDIHKKAEPEIKEFFHQKIQESLRLILHDYTAAQKTGDIRSDIKPEFIVYFLNKMMEMVKDEELSRLYSSPQDMILELTRFFFYGILPRKDKKRTKHA